MDEFDENVKQTIKEEHRFSKAAKERLERIKEMSAKRLAGELKQLEILRRDADKKKKAQRDDFQNNRRLQKIEAEKKEQASADVQAAIKAKEDEDRRTHITNFWSEQAGILQREAESNRKAYLERVKVGSSSSSSPRLARLLLHDLPVARLTLVNSSLITGGLRLHP